MISVLTDQVASVRLGEDSCRRPGRYKIGRFRSSANKPGRDQYGQASNKILSDTRSDRNSACQIRLGVSRMID